VALLLDREYFGSVRASLVVVESSRFELQIHPLAAGVSIGVPRRLARVRAAGSHVARKGVKCEPPISTVSTTSGRPVM
jgi:hypothetical protein